MVQEDDLEKMHFSSKGLDKDVSEAEIFDIETVSLVEGYPPMIKNVPSAYVCELNQEIDLGGGLTIPLVLNVKQIFVDDAVITNKEKLSIAFKPVARIGKSYAFLAQEVEPPQIP